MIARFVFKVDINPSPDGSAAPMVSSIDHFTFRQKGLPDEFVYYVKMNPARLSEHMSFPDRVHLLQALMTTAFAMYTDDLSRDLERQIAEGRKR